MTLRFSPLFTDNMVLQRNADVKIRGHAEPNAEVKVTFHKNEYSAKADENGEWAVNAGKFRESRTPLKMTAASGGDIVAVENILIGDVWLCAGQSNMEMTLDRARHNTPDEMYRHDNFIRQFKLPQIYKFDGPLKDFPENTDGWKEFSPDNAPVFTAAGYFFAKTLRSRYNLPIGLLSSAVGGTPIVAWMSRDMLKNFPEELDVADKCRDSAYVEKTIRDYEEYEREYSERLNAADEGLKQNWHKFDLNDNDWEEVPLCAPAAESGAYWYRKTVDLPAGLRGKEATIFLGTAADMDEVYINGQKIGETYYRYPPREYRFTLPESDKLNITIRLLVFNGNGGYTLGKNYFIATDKRVIDIGGSWKRKVGALFKNRNGEAHPQVFFSYKPTGLYNGVISPLADFAIKGVIWYQGESDSGSHERYDEKTRLLIGGLREIWGENLPFLTTQLAYYEDPYGADWNLIRGKQKDCLDLPNTGLAAAYDLGEHNDLHPLNKRDVGERLARLAMRIAYGETLPPNPFEMYNAGGGKGLR